MSICLKCKKELEDTAKFCSECGTKVSHDILCPQCKKRVNEAFVFCPYCGASVRSDVMVQVRNKPLFEVNKKLLKIGSSAVAAVLVVVLLVSFIITSVSKENYLFYMKDEELFTANMQNLKKWQVSEEFIDSANLDNEKMKNFTSLFSNHVKMSKDKKSIFYIDKLASVTQFSLYHRKMNSNAEATRIARDVTRFEISDKGDCVSYLRQDGALFWDDLEDRQKLASDVTTFYMSEDGKKLLYLTKEGDGYFHIIGKEKQKVDGQITSFGYVCEDMNTVYYLKETELYKKVLGKETELLSSDVKQMVKVYESGEIYYLKGDILTINVEEYVEDDMLEEDATMEEPELPIYPELSDYETQEEYEAASAQYTQAFETYQQAMTKYTRKEEREKLRTMGLVGRTVEIPQYQLCYFDGKKEQIVAEKVESYKTYAEDKAAVIYSAYSDSEVSKVKFSDVDSTYNIENMVRAAFSANCNQYITIKAKISQINQQGADSYSISTQADRVYILAAKTGEQTEDEMTVGTDSMNQFDLYEIKVSGHKIGKTKKIDSNIYYNLKLIDDDHYIYFKDVDENGQNGGMYMDGKKVESDVRLNSVKFDKDTGNLWYMVDWEEKDQYGVLKKYNGEKISKVSDEVYHYEILPTGEVLYLFDYSIDSYEGELYLYKNNKVRKVDEDVVVIIPAGEKE